MDSRFIIDWLSFTIPVEYARTLTRDNVMAIVRRIGLNFEFEERDRGRYGYTKSLNFADCILVLFNEFDEMAPIERQEQVKNMGIHLEITGQGCRYLESVIDEQWQVFFEVLNSYKVKYSRLDIALDDYDGMLDFKVIEKKVKAGEVISTSKKRDVEETIEVNKKEKFDNKGNSKGKTIYFGTRSSSVFIRLYDKKKEQENKGIVVDVDFWQRYEIVLRKEKAEDFIERYIAGETFDYLYLGVIAGAIRFVDKGIDTNKARWKTSDFWEKFLKGTDLIKLQSQIKTPDIEKTISWVDNSVLSSLEVLDEVAKQGNLNLYKILERASKKISDRHKDVLNGFNALREDEKMLIYDKIKQMGR
ncbi:replication initiation factor domain-containing protein [Streptococcus suis]|uniref:replication initiation factor domain-containing protein n=1 Tax=Streptococcus suis TaxID=1307 RepID=UPI001C9836D8|nr:replication initiation factor domain-containing protein [Streptococcus suis]MBY5002399.1 replication initiation factor domain-containing protein [Streptococcus suis]MBY5020278.1 replication initiation factor domain-containing protein [Streptococcus suis]